MNRFKSITSFYTSLELRIYFCLWKRFLIAFFCCCCFCCCYIAVVILSASSQFSNANIFLYQFGMFGKNSINIKCQIVSDQIWDTTLLMERTVCCYLWQFFFSFFLSIRSYFGTIINLSVSCMDVWFFVHCFNFDCVIC